MKKTHIVLLVLFLVIIVPITLVSSKILEPAYLLIDGCQCGARRAYIKFNDPIFVKRLKFRLRYLADGNPDHNHSFWDAQIAEMGAPSLLWTVEWPQLAAKNEKQ